MIPTDPRLLKEVGDLNHPVSTDVKSLPKSMQTIGKLSLFKRQESSISRSTLKSKSTAQSPTDSRFLENS
jgi:hypothetical protein